MDREACPPEYGLVTPLTANTRRHMIVVSTSCKTTLHSERNKYKTNPFAVLRLPKYFLPIILAYLLLIAGNEKHRTAAGANEAGRIHGNAYESTCTWACHNQTTAHCLVRHGGLPDEWRNVLGPAYFGMINSLQSTGSYRLANLVFLALAWPLLLSFGYMRCLILYRRNWAKPLNAVSSVLLIMALVASGVIFSANDPYEYLTDFILTLAHWSDLSYYDINALVFIVAWPGLSALLAVLWPVMEVKQLIASRN